MITIYGDSLLKCVLYENGKYTANHEFELAYREKFGAELENRSYFGSTAAKALARMERDAEKGKPFGDRCVIEFGGNDCSYDWASVAAEPRRWHDSYAEPEDYRETLRALVRLARAQGAQPILTALPPIDAERYLDWISRSLPSQEPLRLWSGGAERFYRRNEFYSLLNLEVAREENVPVVDLRSPFLLKRNVGQYLCEDGIHPNREGQRLMFEAFCAFSEKEREQHGNE